jgi:hypothetical protein
MTIRSLRSIRSTQVLGTVPVPAAIAVAAPYAPAGPIIAATSQTSAVIGLAPTVFAVDQFNVGFAVGMRLRAAATADPSNFVEGVVTDFAEARGEVTIDVDLIGGSGTFDSWNINVAGQPGPKGDRGEAGPQGPQGPAYGAPLDSPLFIGTPRAPTAPLGDRSNLISTTEFVGRALESFQPLHADLTALSGLTETDVIYYRIADATWEPVTVSGGLSFSGGTLQVAGGGFAPSESPILTGDPQAPTPAEGDESDAIATTSFVARALDPYAPIDSPVLTGDPQAPPPANDNGTSIATTAFVQDTIAPLAPIDSPVFTGTPRGPTPVNTESSTTLATTAFVHNALLLAGAGTGIPDAPTDGAHYARRLQSWADLDPLLDAKANLDSPAFTGTPRAPTPPATTADDRIATTSFVRTLSGMYIQLDVVEMFWLSAAHHTMTIGINAAAGNSTLVMPTFASLADGDFWVRLIRLDASANVVRIVLQESGSIDARPSARLIAQFDAATIRKTGTASQWITEDARYQPRAIIYSPGSYQFLTEEQVPLGCLAIDAVVVGSGAGGAGGGGTSRGAGGSGGAMARKRVPTTELGDGLQITVGAAGAGGPFGNYGNNGNTTSFGTLLTATGGNGGMLTGGAVAGRTGGIASGGDLNFSGGESDANETGNLSSVGPGGDAGGGWGLGGRSNVTSPGRGYGGGGACGNHTENTTGGAGATGVCAVFIS